MKAYKAILLFVPLLLLPVFASAGFWSGVLAGEALPAASTRGSAPVVRPAEGETYPSVLIELPLAATDADGDPVILKLVDAPALGKAELEGNLLRYTPGDKTGTDRFTYTAIDTAGNTAEPARIKIRIRRNAAGHTYADMSDNPAHYASLQLSRMGVLTGERIGAAYFFHPNEDVTRGEFIAMTTALAGLPIAPTAHTDFIDDEGLSVWAKPYVSAAAAEGLVAGSPTLNGGTAIRCADPITIAEASAIIGNLLGEQGIIMTLAAEHSGADWAAQTVAALRSAALLPASAQELPADSPITRQTACELLYTATKRLNG